MAQEDRFEDVSHVNDTLALQHTLGGTKVKLRNGEIPKVTDHPRDGGWVFVRFVKYAEEPSRVGEENMVFCADVLAVV